MGKSRGGRRGKYLDWVTEEGLLKIQGWARDGLVDKQIAQNIGISEQTLNVWKKKYPAISESLKKGKEVVDRAVENALLKRALGYKYDEVTQEIVEKRNQETGEYEPTLVPVKVVTKEVQPDTTAQIFWLKNRRPDLWRDKKDINTKLTHKNNPFQELSVDELKKLAKSDD